MKTKSLMILCDRNVEKRLGRQVISAMNILKAMC